MWGEVNKPEEAQEVHGLSENTARSEDHSMVYCTQLPRKVSWVSCVPFYSCPGGRGPVRTPGSRKSAVQIQVNAIHLSGQLTPIIK